MSIQKIKSDIIKIVGNVSASQMIDTLCDGAFFGSLKSDIGCSDDELQVAVESIYCDLAVRAHENRVNK